MGINHELSYQVVGDPIHRPTKRIREKPGVVVDIGSPYEHVVVDAHLAPGQLANRVLDDRLPHVIDGDRVDLGHPLLRLADIDGQ